MRSLQELVNRSTKTQAVVLGCDVNALGYLRALGKSGVYCSAICCRSFSDGAARFSKYARPILIPRNSDYESHLLLRLFEIAEFSTRKIVLFPTNDLSVFLLDKHRAKLSQHYSFPIPDATTLTTVLNKHKTHILASSASCASPNTIIPTSSHSLSSLIHCVTYPSIIKPQDSFSTSFPGKNRVVHNAKELTTFLTQYSDLLGRVIIQEIVPGPETNIYQCSVYVQKDQPPLFFTMQKLHQRPAGYGVTTLGRSLTIPSIIEQTHRLIEAADYTGFGSFEFKQSTKDSLFYLIEINPRLPWYNALFLSSGVNFPYIAYMDLNGNRLSAHELPRQQDDVYWLHFSHELSALVQRRKAGIPMAFGKTVFYALRARSFAYFDLSDLKPFLASIPQLIKAAAKHLYANTLKALLHLWSKHPVP